MSTLYRGQSSIRQRASRTAHARLVSRLRQQPAHGPLARAAIAGRVRASHVRAGRALASRAQATSAGHTRVAPSHNQGLFSPKKKKKSTRFKWHSKPMKTLFYNAQNQLKKGKKKRRKIATKTMGMEKKKIPWKNRDAKPNGSFNGCFKDLNPPRIHQENLEKTHLNSSFHG